MSGAAQRLSALGFAMASALFAASCIEVTGPPPKPPLTARDLKASPGMAIDQTCVPTGVEICFDARDNNCNGVLDEGCGVHTGLLQFVIAWEGDADVDLVVTDPNGDVAHSPATEGGPLVKDHDCPRESECHGQNVENVYLVEGEPLRGKYHVVVQLGKVDPTMSDVVHVHLGVRIGQRTLGSNIELAVSTSRQEKSLDFTL